MKQQPSKESPVYQSAMRCFLKKRHDTNHACWIEPFVERQFHCTGAHCRTPLQVWRPPRHSILAIRLEMYNYAMQCTSRVGQRHLKAVVLCRALAKRRKLNIRTTTATKFECCRQQLSLSLSPIPSRTPVGGVKHTRTIQLIR